MSHQVSRKGARRCAMTLLGALAISATASISFAQINKPVRDQQEMLMWTTDYEGVVDGVHGPGTTEAIKKFQTRLGQEASGVLTLQQWSALEKQGKANRDRVGFRIQHDNRAGIRVGIPVSLVSEPKETKWGKQWYGKEKGIAIDTLRFGPEVSLRQLYDRLLSINNRVVAYQRFADTWFVIAAYEGESAVYVRVQDVKTKSARPEMRGFSIWMGKKRTKEWEAIPSAMLSSFSVYEAGGPIGGPIEGKGRTSLKVPPNPTPGLIVAEGPVISLERCWRGLGDCPPLMRGFKP